jgi:hypothetical protein
MNLEARAVGPYAFVTSQPIAGDENLPGQRIDRPRIDVLVALGAPFVAHEMLTVKSDDVDGRAALAESIAENAPRAAPTVPEGTRFLEAELRALGFVVDFEEDEPAIALATTASVRALAPHAVTIPDTIHFRTRAPQPAGLYCMTIFGEGQPERRRRLGRIELPVPVVHPWFMPVIAEVLERAEEELWAALQAHPAEDGQPPIFALRDALAARGREDLLFEAWPVLPPGLRPLVALGNGRFAVSDINDLYRRVVNRANRLRRLLELRAPAVIVSNEARLLQDAIGDLVENERRKKPIEFEGRTLKSLGDITVERLAHELPKAGKRADYSGAAPVVARPELAMPAALVPRVVANTMYGPLVVAELTRGVRSAEGDARKLITEHATAALDALVTVAARHPLVVLSPHGAACVEARFWDEPAIGLPNETLHALRLLPGDAAQLHVPLDLRAVAEALPLRVARAAPPVASADSDGWIARAAAAKPEDAGRLLVRAALGREKDSVRSLVARLVLGRPLAP